MRDTAIMEIAIHEAGHAVVAYVLGVEVFDIAVYDSIGHCGHDLPATLLDAGMDAASVAFVFGKIACAGQAASSAPMSAEDNRGVEDAIWLSGLIMDFFEARTAWLAQAKALVDTHREKIDLVATALVRRGRLSGDEFRAILEANNATQN